MASVVVELTGDETRLLRSLQKVIQKEQEHQEKLRDTGEEGKKAGDRVKEGFDKAGRGAQTTGRNVGNLKSDFSVFSESAVKSIGVVTLAYKGIHDAIRTSIDLRKEELQTNQDAVDAARQLVPARQRLAQVARGDTAEDRRADLQQLFAAADDFAQQAVVSREAAAEVIFSARSEGFEEALPAIIRNAPVVSPAAQARVAGQLPKLFEGITPTQAISGVLAGAELSSQDFQTIARVTATAASGSALGGATAQETIAGIAVLTDAFKSAEQASEAFRTFQTAVGLDKPLTEAELTEARQQEDERLEVAARAFRSLQERRNDIRESLQRVREDEPESAREAESQQRRIEDLQKDLDRANRSVAEFDQTRLQRREVGETRQRLRGLTLAEQFEALAGFTEDERRDFLGENQQLNQFYEITRKRIDRITEQAKIVGEAFDSAGTERDIVQAKADALLEQPAVQEGRRLRRAEIAEEIAESRRVGEEATTQAEIAEAFAAAERGGASGLRVAIARRAVSAARVFGLDEQAADIASRVAGDPLEAFQRQFAAGEDVSGQLLIQSLRSRRAEDAGATIDAPTLARFLRSRGQEIAPEELTQADLRVFTEAIDQRASETQNRFFVGAADELLNFTAQTIAAGGEGLQLTAQRQGTALINLAEELRLGQQPTQSLPSEEVLAETPAIENLPSGFQESVTQTATPQIDLAGQLPAPGVADQLFREREQQEETKQSREELVKLREAMDKQNTLTEEMLQASNRTADASEDTAVASKETAAKIPNPEPVNAGDAQRNARR